MLVKVHRKYPDNYFMGCYMLEDSLINSILEWKNRNEHLGERNVLQNKFSNDISKVCKQWGLESTSNEPPWDSYKKALRICFDKYFENFSNAKSMHGGLELEHYNLQHYKPSEGFYMWHKENNGEPDVLHRHLVFMTYLTDTSDAGTEFMTQNITVPCERGVTLIWPAAWTHTHRGQISLTNEKTIVTGWLRIKPTNN